MKHGTKRILILLPIMIIYIILLYISGPDWNTSHGVSVIYSVLAFLCLILVVSLNNLIRIENTIANQLIAGTANYGFLVFAGSAISNLWRVDNGPIHLQPHGILLNLIGLLIASTLFFAFGHQVGKNGSKSDSGVLSHLRIIVAVIGVGISIMFAIIIRADTPVDIILIAGYAIGSIAFILFFAAGVLIFKKRESVISIDPYRIAIAAWLLSAAAITHIYILSSPSVLWLLSIGFIIMAFIYAVIGITVHYLIMIEVDSKRAYVFSLGINLVILFPVLGIYLINSLTAGTTIVNVGVTVIIHLSASLMAGGAAYMMIMRSRRAPVPWHTPIILLLLFWCAAEIIISISPMLPIYNGTVSLMPYIIGSIIASLVLYIAYRAAFSPRLSVVQFRPKWFYIMAIAIFILILVFAEFVRFQLFQAFPDFAHDSFVQSALAPTIMLVFSYFTLFGMLSLFFVLISLHGGRFTFDTNLANISVVWVIVVLLRANFSVWTTGWWMTDFLLYLTAVGCILYLIKVHVDEVRIREDYQERILIQKEVLLKDLLSEIQMVEDHIEALGRTNEMDSRLDIVSRALSQLSHAESIAQRINAVLTESVIASSDLVPMDFAEICKTELTTERVGCTPTFTGSLKECTILANDLLVDAIHKVMEFLVNRIGLLNELAVEFSHNLDSETPMCIAEMRMTIRTDYAHESRTCSLGT